MNPLDDHELLLWAMRAGLIRDEVRQAVRHGLGAGDLSWPGASETALDRQHRLQAARDYLYDQLLSGYDRYRSAHAETCFLAYAHCGSVKGRTYVNLSKSVQTLSHATSL